MDYGGVTGPIVLLKYTPGWHIARIRNSRVTKFRNSAISGCIARLQSWTDNHRTRRDHKRVARCRRPRVFIGAVPLKSSWKLKSWLVFNVALPSNGYRSLPHLSWNCPSGDRNSHTGREREPPRAEFQSNCSQRGQRT